MLFIDKREGKRDSQWRMNVEKEFPPQIITRKLSEMYFIEAVTIMAISVSTLRRCEEGCGEDTDTTEAG